MCADSNDVDRGTQLIERMRDEGVTPDRRTIDVLDRRKVLRTYLKKVAWW